jgi:transglutaminase-like putative cysteine protease
LANSSPAAPAESPERWTGSTALLDLQDSRIRLRAQALTQLCRSDRERVLAIYSFVKRIPFAKPAKLRFRTAREVLDAGRGDADDKGSLFVALLRAAGFPARLCYVELHGDILRGLTDAIDSAGRPVVQVWLDGRWASTDTYIFDASYAAAARRRLEQQGWEWGYGLHSKGQLLWDGLNDAFLTGGPETSEAVSLGPLGVFHDPADFVASDAYKARYVRIGRVMRWGLVAPAIGRAVSDLRSETAGPAAPHRDSPA